MFVGVILSVHLLAGLLKNLWMNFYEIFGRSNRLDFGMIWICIFI